jgi:MinD superfamily P-loop ATPase
MKEIIVISGKGGTGKTSVTAALASLASRSSKAVFADCDVDAADLHLIFSPTILAAHDFISGHEAIIDPALCTRCGKCMELCRFDAVQFSEQTGYSISACEGCGLCVQYCPVQAISFPDRLCGQWYISDTRFGTLVHAQLDAQAENSGKLVSLVRKEARLAAETQNADYLIVDGSPGIGCPVIASITGADVVLAVAEPSLSGKHDLERVIELTRHFKVPLMVAINKFDINPDLALEIKRTCIAAHVPLAGFIAYNTEITAAQIQGKSIIEYNEHSAVAEQIGLVWKNILEESWKQ